MFIADSQTSSGSYGRVITEKAIPPESQIVFDLSAILNYPIQLVVQTWHSQKPLSWFSQNSEGIVAEGRFLEAPGLPLFTLEDDAGIRISDEVPEEILAVARSMPAMGFELAQACAASQAARELAVSSPLLFILAVRHTRSQPLSIEELEHLLAQPELLALLRHHPDLHLNHLRFLLRQRHPYGPACCALWMSIPRPWIFPGCAG